MPQIQMLHLEAMEETQNKSKESDAAGNPGMAGEGGEQLPKSLLAHGEKWPCPKGDPRPIRVFALMRLNRRIPNGGVIGRFLN